MDFLGMLDFPDNNFEVSDEDEQPTTENIQQDDLDSETLNLPKPSEVEPENLKDDTAKENLRNEESVNPVRYVTKRTLKYQCPNSALEPLPEDWVLVNHCSGMPVYLNKKTRVITLSRPYVVGPGAVKKHNIPVSSIPCLDYLRTLKRFKQAQALDSVPPCTEKMSNGVNETNGSEDKSHDTNTAPSLNESGTKVATVFLQNQATEQLDEAELQEYLNKRFMFETTQIPHFEKWSDKRKYVRQQKEGMETNAAGLKKLGPAKVITLSIPRDNDSEKPQRMTFTTSVKPMICILHEYAQSVLRTKPHYVFSTNEDASEPFEATIVLNEKQYGTASGINKKSAKNKAALLTMEMLVPGFKEQVENLQSDQSLEYFDEVSITDPRVYELCVHAGNYLPHQLLTECLKRNQGIADTNVQFDVQVGKAKMVEYKMTCGKHVVTGTAKNKKVGKQIASQQVLKLLHPDTQTWGELIQLYGTSVAEKRARKKNIEQEIFELKQRRNLDSGHKSFNAEDGKETDSNSQDKKNALAPNPELLSKLRDMMMDLEKKAKKRTGDDQDQPDKKRNKLLLIDV